VDEVSRSCFPSSSSLLSCQCLERKRKLLDSRFSLLASPSSSLPPHPANSERLVSSGHPFLPFSAKSRTDLPRFSFCSSLEWCRSRHSRQLTTLPPSAPIALHLLRLPSPSLLPPPLVPSSSTRTATMEPLFLSVDAGVSKLRACVLSSALQVVWVDQVVLDSELPEFGCVLPPATTCRVVLTD
jgi:hypothetical protein